MIRTTWLKFATVSLTLVVAGAVMAGPYWAGTYNDGRGVVCRDIANNRYYAMFLVPTAAGGLTAGQRAAITAGRLNALYNPNTPYRSTQILAGKLNGQDIVYIANRYNTSGQYNNWLILTIDPAWARNAGTSTAGAALYWRDRMRWLAANWQLNSRGQWERILTAQGRGGEEAPLTADQKALANETVCDKIPKNYEKRADKDPKFEGGLNPLPTTVPENEKIRELK